MTSCICAGLSWGDLKLVWRRRRLLIPREPLNVPPPPPDPSEDIDPVLDQDTPIWYTRETNKPGFFLLFFFFSLQIPTQARMYKYRARDFAYKRVGSTSVHYITFGKPSTFLAMSFPPHSFLIFREKRCNATSAVNRHVAFNAKCVCQNEFKQREDLKSVSYNSFLFSDFKVNNRETLY